MWLLDLLSAVQTLTAQEDQCLIVSVIPSVFFLETAVLILIKRAQVSL